ncbi:DUF5659 domain-containing protein [Brassicibacter mesophilus]|uniref:DUF5659 domain-containing protein n=1 Tax=Brassicibacter mesophilus TaxID=745119 RepID=UPI003D20A780
MENTEKRDDYWVTSKFINSYLISNGFKHNKVEKVGNKIGFFYPKNNELFAAIKAYKENEEIRKLVHNYHVVNDLIKGAKY